MSVSVRDVLGSPALLVLLVDDGDLLCQGDPILMLWEEVTSFSILVRSDLPAGDWLYVPERTVYNSQVWDLHILSY